MATIKTIRTTAFRLTDEHFGVVHVYRPGPHFSRAWSRLRDNWQKRGDVGDLRYLPYAGLASALRCLSGDFVALQRRVDRERAVILSRQPIGPDQLEMAFAAWETSALGLDDAPLSRLIDDLTQERVEIAGLVRYRQGRPPTLDGGNWPWDVAIWEVAHRLAASQMRTDRGSVALRVDSDAALLTWNDLVELEGKAAAMHKIVPLLITVPGVEEPVVSFQSSLVRLAPSWKASRGSRFAWAELRGDAPILRARVRHRPAGEGFEAEWADRAAGVLRGASLNPLPAVSAEPSLRGVLRCGYSRQPPGHPIGKGVGPWFHECVAHHARASLGDGAVPVTLEATKAMWPSRKTIAPRPPVVAAQDEAEVGLRILVVYADSSVRRRVRDALAHVLEDGAPPLDLEAIETFCRDLRALDDGETLRLGSVEVRFVRPPQAEQWLLRRSRADAIVSWLDAWLPGEREGDALLAALVETDESAAKGSDALRDPKHVLRSALAERGVVTQFITTASEPSRRAIEKAKQEDRFGDHPAANAVADLMRGAGFFLRPFPAYGVEAGTLLVGVYGARVTKKKSGKQKATYLVNLVAVETGGREAWGYVPGAGWRPLHEATARFLASDHDHGKHDAPKVVETAVEQLRLSFPGRPVVLLFDALGCRKFWDGLKDTSHGRPEPWMVPGKRAVIRVRALASELVRPAGAHDWTQAFTPARHTDFKPMRVVDARGDAPALVLSGSAVMNTVRSARTSSRFGASEKGLGEEWHSLGVTELLVVEPGQWDPDKLIEQAAMLCRVAPTWDRVLRWPSPLHLARAIVRDHPFRYFHEAAMEVEEPEDGKQMRFDF